MEDGGQLASHGAQREQAIACRNVDHAAYACLTHRNRAAKVVVPEQVSAGRIESVMMPIKGACIRDPLGDRLYRWPIRITVGVSVRAHCTTTATSTIARIGSSRNDFKRMSRKISLSAHRTVISKRLCAQKIEPI